MGISERLRQGLAGLGAYCLCLLAVVLGPSGNLGGLFGPVLALLSLGLVFIGGMQFSLVNPAWAMLTSRPGPNLYCAFSSFFVFAMMASLALGPVQLALQLDMAEEMSDVRICDWPSWQDTGGGVYFRDGTIIPSGEIPGAGVTEISVTHCEWHSEGWEPCRFGVRPIFDCPPSRDQNQRCDQICAWAFVADMRMPFDSSCGSHGSGGVCGIAVSLQGLTAGRCAGPEREDRSCVEVHQKLSKELQAVAANFSLPGGEVGAMAPLLLLGDPRAVRDKLNVFIWAFLLFAVVYVPLPLLAAYCVTQAEPCGCGFWPWAVSARAPAHAEVGTPYLVL